MRVRGNRTIRNGKVGLVVKAAIVLAAAFGFSRAPLADPLPVDFKMW